MLAPENILSVAAAGNCRDLAPVKIHLLLHFAANLFFRKNGERNSLIQVARRLTTTKKINKPVK